MTFYVKLFAYCYLYQYFSHKNEIVMLSWKRESIWKRRILAYGCCLWTFSKWIKIVYLNLNIKKYISKNEHIDWLKKNSNALACRFAFHDFNLNILLSCPYPKPAILELVAKRIRTRLNCIKLTFCGLAVWCWVLRFVFLWEVHYFREAGSFCT